MKNQVSNPIHQVSNSTNSPVGFRPTEYAAYPIKSSSTDEIPDNANLQQKVSAIADEIEGRNNLAYGIGRILRNIWDYVSDFRIGLPGAEARSFEYSPDSEVDNALSSLQVRFVADEEQKESIMVSPLAMQKMQERAVIIIKNLKQEFAKAALEGPQTKKLILECLNSAKIAILDTEYSRYSIKRYEKMLGSEVFGGLYIASLNELILSGSFDGKKNLGTIIHECSHVREVAQNVNYDVSKMSQCVDNLKKLGVMAVQCLDGEKSIDCGAVNNLAKSYLNRDVLVHREKISNPQNQKTGLLGVLTIADGLKLQNNGAVIEYSASNDRKLYSLKLDGIQNTKTGVRIPASGTQQNLYKLAKNVGELPTDKEIGEMYKKESEEVKTKEFHAAIVDKVPEKLLDQVCADGFLPTTNPLHATSENLNSQKSKEL